MPSDQPLETAAESTYSCTATEIGAILEDRGWLNAAAGANQDTAMQGWLSRAADLLGPHASTRDELAGLLEPIFSYDAAQLLYRRENQEVLARTGAREVIREFANRVLDGGDIDSDRFKQIIDAMKEAVPYRSRSMFHPIRLALTGRAGEGELDRVILLIDGAAKLNFAVVVKSTRQRILEFCAALD
jgi:glutamyl/glutaminyl-tRNA synthetase